VPKRALSEAESGVVSSCASEIFAHAAPIVARSSRCAPSGATTLTRTPSAVSIFRSESTFD
jgi:hypothetical protein